MFPNYATDSHDWAGTAHGEAASVTTAGGTSADPVTGTCEDMCFTFQEAAFPAGIPATTGYVGLFASDLGFCSAPCTYHLGATRSDYDSVTGEYNSADIYINNNANVPWAPGGAYLADSSQYSEPQVLRHEFGHAAGLDHPVLGGGTHNYMQCRQNFGDWDETPVDDVQNGLGWLYAKGPYSTYGSPTGAIQC